MIVNIGKGITLDVDTNRLGFGPLEEGKANYHLVYIGARNVLMDSHASISKEEEDFVAKSRAMAEKKLAALYAGEVRVNGERGPRLDPVDAEAKRIALGAVQKAVRAQGRKMTTLKTDEVQELIKVYLNTHPNTFKIAKQIVGLRAEVV